MCQQILSPVWITVYHNRQELDPILAMMTLGLCVASYFLS